MVRSRATAASTASWSAYVGAGPHRGRAGPPGRAPAPRWRRARSAVSSPPQGTRHRRWGSRTPSRATIISAITPPSTRPVTAAQRPSPRPRRHRRPRPPPRRAVPTRNPRPAARCPSRGPAGHGEDAQQEGDVRRAGRTVGGEVDAAGRCVVGHGDDARNPGAPATSRPAPTPGVRAAPTRTAPAGTTGRPAPAGARAVTVHVQLHEDAAGVGLDGALAEEQPLRDARVGQPLGHQLEHRRARGR